jgi:TRAP-type C4-dicarboxylate transport system substrate-binding protein
MNAILNPPPLAQPPRNPRRWSAATLALAAALLATPALRAAEALKVRLATLAPKDTSFHKSLMTMGESWRQSSGGTVTLTIYTDGTMGGEADMVRRMRIGQVQAAMLSVNGLQLIDESATGVQLMPMAFRSLDEVDFVREKLRPQIEEKFLQKGFKILFWGDAGWVRFFAKQPALVPDDYKKIKVFVWAGDPKSQEVMKAAGIQAVPLETTDALTGLQTGLIDCIPSIPVYALAGQFYGPASHMLAINWTPLVGATVITRKVWDSIPASQQPALLQAAAAAGEQIKLRSRTESDEAVEAMRKRGLTVHVPSPEVVAAWTKFAQDVYPQIRGKLVPADMFDAVQQALGEFRAGAAK